MAGKLEAIWIKRAHRGPMDQAQTAKLIDDKGIEGNVDRSRRRQVTILELEKWNEFMSALGTDLPSSGRRANLIVSGVSLAHTRGRTLRIGNVVLEIGGETTPCERMDEFKPGLKSLMKPDWGGGAFARVISGGDIAVGDDVLMEENPAPAA